jgi:hypothetical protein
MRFITLDLHEKSVEESYTTLRVARPTRAVKSERLVEKLHEPLCDRYFVPEITGKAECCIAEVAEGSVLHPELQSFQTTWLISFPCALQTRIQNGSLLQRQNW